MQSQNLTRRPEQDQFFNLTACVVLYSTISVAFAERSNSSKIFMQSCAGIVVLLHDTTCLRKAARGCHPHVEIRLQERNTRLRNG